MFVKITKAGKYEYVQIVRSFKDQDNVTRHEVLANLGRKDQLEDNPSFQRVIKKLAELAGLDEYKRKNGDPLSTASEADMRNWGHIVYRKLWDNLCFNECMDKIQKQNPRIKLNLASSAYLMVVQHLLNPRSKLATFNNKEKYLGLSEMGLQHLYRSLDLLCRGKEEIESHIFYEGYDLLNMTIDVVFYDVTTFAFQSVVQDDLRDFGYSKDNKYNEVQVVMGLLMDVNAQPIGYELYNGSTFDGNTMTAALENLKKRFGIRRVIIVADRGLNSKINLLHIKKAGYGYIMATRLKKMSKKIQEQVLSSEGYMTINGPFTDSEGKPEVIQYKVLEYTNPVKDEKQEVHNLPEHLILTYSERRAAKDRKDRERAVEKAKILIQEPGKLNAALKRGYRKYVRKTSAEKAEATYSLNEAIIQSESRFDGYYGIQTSELEMDSSKILDAYHTLWKIEESFRIMKSHLEARPVFHWTEPRIKGHFVVCFLALLLERRLEKTLMKAGITDYSPQQIREAINSMQFAEFVMDDRRYYLKTRTTSLGNKILKELKIKPPNNLMPVEEYKA
ncbi:MAG: IS1634 family transposase [Peptococcaceae bacterium]|nr:IS1634 family transposase [Peptococcaceae bacterium]